MSGIGFFEFLILCMIGLVVLGPKRLPQVASQLGSWVGQARRLTRSLKRQLEEELDFEEELNLGPSAIKSRSMPPVDHPPPRDDDTYSPAHEPAPSGSIDLDRDGSVERDEFDIEPDFDDEAPAKASDETSDEASDEAADDKAKRSV